MMRKLFFILTIFFLWYGLVEASFDIVAVQSTRISPYEDVVKGFKNTCTREIRRFVLSEASEADVLKKINTIRPDLILAIGMDALSVVKGIRGTPIVYVMVLDPESILSKEKNITGISMNIPQKRQLYILSQFLPLVKRIGLLYDPKKTGRLAERARDAAAKAGITLTAEEVHHPRKVVPSIQKMKEQIDLFWMLPDITIITEETTEFLLLFSLENRIPILTFSEKYVEIGAFISIGIDAFDMGVQAGEIVKMILSGKKITTMRRVEARKAIVSVNLKIARKLGIRIDKKVLKGVNIID